MTDTVKALQRLKRRFGRMRARLERWEERDRKEPGGTEHANRCRYEATQWSLAIGMIDCEIRKAKR